MAGAINVHGHGAGDWRERKMVSSVFLTSDDADIRSFPTYIPPTTMGRPTSEFKLRSARFWVQFGSHHGQLSIPEC